MLQKPELSTGLMGLLAHMQTFTKYSVQWSTQSQNPRLVSFGTLVGEEWGGGDKCAIHVGLT